MWQPEPGWQRLPGAGPATVGVWSATHRGRDVVVKRLRCPDPHDAPSALLPRDVNYWRRAADVALSGVVAGAPGLREAPVVRVEEDDEGITLVHERVEHHDAPGPWLAACLGRFAATDLGAHGWLAARPAPQPARAWSSDAAGGDCSPARRWPTSPTTCGRTARSGSTAATRCRRSPSTATRRPPTSPAATPLPTVTVPSRSTGRTSAADRSVPTSATSPSRRGRRSTPSWRRTSPRSRPALATPEQVVTGARVMAVYTALTRLDWALARVADGEGALAGKFRHPSVAPYIHCHAAPGRPDRGAPRR